MAILVVDDESSTREALRSLLERMGQVPVLEAKHGEEAIKILSAPTANRIEMIIADWEMPYMDGLTLARSIAKLPQLDLIPFLLITSDLPVTRIKEFHNESPRLDAHLYKPFRMKKLEEAMQEAARNRARSRRTALYVGEELPTALSAAVAEGGDSMFSELLVVRNQVELGQSINASGRTVGAVFLDPAGARGWVKLDLAWLAQFKKSPLGVSTPLVCLSRKPDQVREVRLLCQYFTEVPESPDDALAFWRGWLAALTARAVGGWKIDAHADAARKALQAKDFKAARDAALAILELDLNDNAAHAMAAEAFEKLGDVKSAAEHYRKAVQINPCEPRPYLRLLVLLTGEARAETELRQLATLAASFCPASPDVLVASARTYAAIGEVQAAKQMLDRVLKAAPGHAGAQALAAELKGDAK